MAPETPADRQTRSQTAPSKGDEVVDAVSDGGGGGGRGEAARGDQRAGVELAVLGVRQWHGEPLVFGHVAIEPPRPPRLGQQEVCGMEGPRA